MIESHEASVSAAKLARMIRSATFQPAPMRPWWVRSCPAVGESADWLPGVDRVTVYRVGEALMAVAAWSSASRPGGVAWAVAELEPELTEARQAC